MTTTQTASDVPASGVADYAARLEAKRDRLLARAERRSESAADASQRARAMLDLIPPGQPILVGHYSERGHRAHLARIDRAFRRASTDAAIAATLQRRADRLGRNGISSDDPTALDQLNAKLARLERRQAFMKQANALIRTGLRTSEAEAVRLLVATGHVAEHEAWELVRPDFCGRRGFPDYAMSNGNAEIRRIRQRIATLAERATTPVATGSERNGVAWFEDRDENRVCVTFPGKPSADVIADLKRNGFRWSPRFGRWQRQTSNAALHHAQRIAEAAS